MRALRKRGKALGVVAALAGLVVYATAAFGDDLTNHLDATVDATKEPLALTEGGANGVVQLFVQEANGDGKNGCNIQGPTASVTFSVTSSNTAVATVSPSSVTLNNCGDTPSVTVNPVGQGTADVTFAETANTTSGSWVANTADFAVTVGAGGGGGNNPPTVSTAALDASGNEGDTLNTSGAFADDDGDTLAISKSSGDGTVTDNGDGTWSWTLATTDNGGGTVVVEADDGNGGTAQDTFTWSAANVAPTITALTPNVSNALSGESVTFTGTATDPSEVDTTAGFKWSFDGGTTYGLAGANTYTTSFSSCGTGNTVSALAKDKDDGVSDLFTSSAVSVYDAAILDPLKQGVQNAIKRGQVVPVKLSVGCGGAPNSALSPSVRLVAGDQAASTDTDDPVQSITTSVSNADTTGVMRLTEPGKYIYNMQIPSNAAVDSVYTVVVRPYGQGTGARTALVKIRK